MYKKVLKITAFSLAMILILSLTAWIIVKSVMLEAVEIVGASMENTLSDGEVVYVNTKKTPTYNDIIIIMIGESSPTNLRSSTISAQFVVTAAGVIYSYGLGLPLTTALGNTMIGTVVLCMSLPGFVLALLALFTKTHDTTGINMDTVTGCEWD